MLPQNQCFCCCGFYATFTSPNNVRTYIPRYDLTGVAVVITDAVSIINSHMIAIYEPEINVTLYIFMYVCMYAYILKIFFQSFFHFCSSLFVLH